MVVDTDYDKPQIESEKELLAIDSESMKPEV